MINFIAVAIAAAAIAAVGYYIFVYKKKGTVSGTVASTGWSIVNSANMPAQMTKASDGRYFFDFPQKDGVHYVVEQAPSLNLGQLVSLTFNISGAGTIVPVQGNTAQISLIVQRKGDDLSGSGSYQQYRYWHSASPLVSGDGSLSATLTPDQWTDVFGRSGSDFPNQFQDCLANAVYIGMTFGDPQAQAAGHGCYVKNGNARFSLKSFTIQ